VCVSH